VLQHYGSEAVGSCCIPSLQEDLSLIRDLIETQPHDLEFVKRCLARIVFYQNKRGKPYVGCPLGFATNPAMLRQHFPHAKIIVCVRDPCQSVPSYFDLLHNMQGKPGSKFPEHMRTQYQLYSVKLYKALAEWKGDKNTIWVDFEDWKDNGVKELERIWGHLGWKAPAKASQAALKKSERH
jgi:hypothetical protein